MSSFHGRYSSRMSTRCTESQLKTNLTPENVPSLILGICTYFIVVKINTRGKQQTSGLQDFKRLHNRDFKFSQNFKRLPKTSKDFQRLQETSKDFKRLPKTFKDFKRLQETSRDFMGLHETSRDFMRLHGTS
jgi:hypothetical protein